MSTASILRARGIQARALQARGQEVPEHLRSGLKFIERVERINPATQRDIARQVQERGSQIDVAREGGKRTSRTPQPSTGRAITREQFEANRRIPIEVITEGRITTGAVTKFAPEVLKKAEEAIKKEAEEDIKKKEEKTIIPIEEDRKKKDITKALQNLDKIAQGESPKELIALTPTIERNIIETGEAKPLFKEIPFEFYKKTGENLLGFVKKAGTGSLALTAFPMDVDESIKDKRLRLVNPKEFIKREDVRTASLIIGFTIGARFTPQIISKVLPIATTFTGLSLIAKPTPEKAATYATLQSGKLVNFIGKISPIKIKQLQ